MRPFRCWLLDEPEENPPVKAPKKGVSRLFRCWLLDEDETPLKRALKPMVKYRADQTSGAGGGSLLKAATPRGVIPHAPRKRKPALSPAITAVLADDDWL